MRFGKIAVVALVGVVAACAPTAGPSTPSPSDPPAPSPSGSPGTLPTATPGADSSPLDADHLPHQFLVTGALTESDNAVRVVDALHTVARRLPAVKLDITVSAATLSVLDEHQRVITYRWADDSIDAAATDFEFLGQQTFDPKDYPIESVGKMFDIADLLGVSGKLVYQVQDYRQQQVVQTVSSKPESSTVFFLKDVTAVPDLGTTNAQDITLGLQSVVSDAQEIVEFGFNAERGYWALVSEDDRQRLRIRKDGIPTFEAPATSGGLTSRPTFDPHAIEPMVLARAIAEHQPSPESTCEVNVQVRQPLSTASVQLTCDGSSHFLSLDGQSLDDELGPG